jgi:subtilase family serine protease
MNGTGSSYASETVWNWGGGTGSSGGISSFYSIPSWQTNVNVVAAQGSASFRNIPDVALTADNVYVAYGNGSSEAVGGTSCAAPLWAGFMALVNQQATLAGRSPVGFINPAIYTIAQGANYTSCFHDITTGNNTSPDSPSLFSATNGYDLCTGLGTPNGQNLINALVEDLNQSIVLNGGFEIGNFTDWTLTGTSAANYNFVDSGSPVSPHSGTYVAALGEVGSLATLSQTLPTQPGQSYLLSAWLENSSNKKNTPTQQFLVNWNTNAPATSTIFNQTYTAAFGWTNILLRVTAAGTNTVLQFQARNDPSYFGLDDVVVTPIPAPTLQTIADSGGAFQFTWNALANVAYQVQYKTNLFQTNWINLGTSIKAAASTMTATNTGSTDRQRFYRVIVP